MRDHAGPRLTVDVWVAEPADDDAGRWLAHLDDDEQARARSLPGHQAARFIQTRALLRGALGPRLGCRARAVALRVECALCGGAHGPVLLDGDGRPFVSVTRAGPLIGVAITNEGPVGVDIESHAAVAAAPLDTVAFSAAELAVHRRRRWGARTPALARAWVSAEATLKATGTGLRTDPAHLVHSRRGHRTATTPDGTRALLADLDLGPRLAGAVAVVPDGSWATEHAGADPCSQPRLTIRLLDGGAVLAGLR